MIRLINVTNSHGIGSVVEEVVSEAAARLSGSACRGPPLAPRGQGDRAAGAKVSDCSSWALKAVEVDTIAEFGCSSPAGDSHLHEALLGTEEVFACTTGHRRRLRTMSTVPLICCYQNSSLRAGCLRRSPRSPVFVRAS